MLFIWIIWTKEVTNVRMHTTAAEMQILQH